MKEETMKVMIDGFEGPLDLLLHLIHQLKIDIYDIPIALITEQYMTYVSKMKALQLDSVSKYMVMAATLLSIKSKLLLPVEEERQLDDDYEDPRQELVDQLLEYQKFKAASEWFDQKQEAQLGFYSHELVDLSSYADGATLIENAHYVEQLQMMMQHLMTKKQALTQPQKTIEKDEVTLQDKVQEITDLLKSRKEIIVQSFLQTQPIHAQVVSFLAILEMVKNHQLCLEQHGTYQTLYMRWRESHGSKD